MDKSDAINDLAAALCKAQAELPAAPMNATNPFLKNRYADLGSIIRTAQPVLAKHDLSVSQTVGSWDNAVSVTTVLMHKSGQYISDTIGMEVGEERGKSAAQVAGSIITYLRRYSLAAIIGMYADEDADGNAPQQKKSPAKQAAKATTNGKRPTTAVSDKPKRVWPQETIMAVQEAGGYKAVKHTVAILDLSTMAADTPADVMVAWHTEYRRQRDAEVDVKSAAAAADAACEPSDG